MQNLILIKVETAADLADILPDSNFIIQVQDEDQLYRGNGTAIPYRMFDENSLQPIRGNISKKTTTYTLQETDFILECDGTFTVTLFSADGMLTGQIYIIKNSGSGTITVDADGMDLIDGAGSVTLNAGEVARLCVNNNTDGWLLL
jgi:hypothetical protein